MKDPAELLRLMDTSGSSGGVTGTGEVRLPVLIFFGMKFEYFGFIFIDFPLAGSFASCNGIADSDWVGITGEDLSVMTMLMKQLRKEPSVNLTLQSR